MVQENSLSQLLIICGPTASGKSELAAECAKMLGSEVISADSMYIYKGLDIGTAKPVKEEMRGVTHHMIDVADFFSSFTVSDYERTALPVVKSLISRGKVPVICGGTGFYINSLLYDFSYGNGQCAPLVREKYKALAEIFGNEYVYGILQRCDPETAKKLHHNDVKRVIRALEIFENGIKKSDITDELIPRFSYSAYCIDYPREKLYERIDKRVDKMIACGLVEEVKKLIEAGVTSKNQCMQGIGYKETYAYLTGKCTLEEAADAIKLNTRHYAKRQITFFKKLPGLVFLQPDLPEINAQRIIKQWI